MLLSAVASSSWAAPRVYVSGTADNVDTVGQRLLYQVREGIRKSAGMELADSEDQSIITVSITSMAPDKDDNARTVLSAAWSVVNPSNLTGLRFYLSSSVRICGTNRVATCAEGIVAETEKHIVTFGPVVSKMVSDLYGVPTK